MPLSAAVVPRQRYAQRAHAHQNQTRPMAVLSFARMSPLALTDSLAIWMLGNLADAMSLEVLVNVVS